jgi:hypothetical protein
VQGIWYAITKQPVLRTNLLQQLSQHSLACNVEHWCDVQRVCKIAAAAQAHAWGNCSSGSTVWKDASILQLPVLLYETHCQHGYACTHRCNTIQLPYACAIWLYEQVCHAPALATMAAAAAVMHPAEPINNEILVLSTSWHGIMIMLFTSRIQQHCFCS